MDRGGIRISEDDTSLLLLARLVIPSKAFVCRVPSILVFEPRNGGYFFSCRAHHGENLRGPTCTCAPRTRPGRSRVPRASRSAFAMVSSRTSASAAARERRARALTSPSSFVSTVFAILALARVVDAQWVEEFPGDMDPLPGAWTDEDRPSGTHSGEQLDPAYKVDNLYDGDISGGKDLTANKETWSMFYSGKALGPWVQLNLGAERIILAIEIYGHRAEPKCDLNLLDESFWSPLCDGSNLEPFNPTYSYDSYDDTEKQGAVIGVGSPGDGPCVDEKSSVDGSTVGNCAGYVCATITTMSELGFVNNEGTVHKEQSDASVKVMWYASPFLRRAGLAGHVPSQTDD